MRAMRLPTRTTEKAPSSPAGVVSFPLVSRIQLVSCGLYWTLMH